MAGGGGDVDCADKEAGFDSAPAFTPCLLAPSNVARVCTAADATSEGAIAETAANGGSGSGGGGCALGASRGRCPAERHCGSDEDAAEGAADDDDVGG